MTDEEKRFDRREEARLDDMYDAQFETEEEEEMKPTQEQVIAWAREAGMEVGAGLLMKDVYGQSPSIEHIQAAFTLAYETGRKDERERILDMCKEGLWDGAGIKFHLDKQGENND